MRPWGEKRVTLLSAIFFENKRKNKFKNTSSHWVNRELDCTQCWCLENSTTQSPNLVMLALQRTG